MRRILLLTGTPYRKDHNERVAEAWIGPVTFQTKRIYTRPVYVRVIDLIYTPIKLKLNYKKKIDYVSLINDLVNSDERNEQIINQIINLINENRQILVLSERSDKIKHLHNLQKMLLDKNSEISTCLFYGKTKKKERILSVTSQVIFSTYSMASEALDIPSLSALILSTPKQNIEQSIMRVIRGKYQLYDPIIIDFRDNFGICYNYWKKRYLFYKQEKFNIQFINKKINNSSNNEELNYFSENKEDNICPFENSNDKIDYNLFENNNKKIKKN